MNHKRGHEPKRALFKTVLKGRLVTYSLLEDLPMCLWQQESVKEVQ
jgi:hypothetical protein